jgi:uncharacterized protein (DUF2141 family)
VLAILLVLALAAEAEPSASATIRAVVSEVRNRSGRVGCSVYDSAEGFPSESAKAIQRHWVEIAGSSVVCEFTGLRPGTYAVAVFHDENGNGKLDKGLFGKPTEGWGTSNNVQHSFSAPSFEESKVTLSPGATLELALTLHY